MRTSTKFLIAFVLSAGVLLLSASAGLLLAVAADLGVAAQWPATYALGSRVATGSAIAGGFTAYFAAVGTCIHWRDK